MLFVGFLPLVSLRNEFSFFLKFLSAQSELAPQSHCVSHIGANLARWLTVKSSRNLVKNRLKCCISRNGNAEAS